MDDFDDLLAGLDALDDFLRRGTLALTRSMKSRATLKFTSASSKRQAHLAQGVADVGLGNLAEAAQVAEGVLELAA